MSIPGTLPATDIEHATGIEYTATFDGTSTWTCYRRDPGETTDTMVGVIATDGTRNQAGLTCDVAQQGAIHFRYDDGTGVQKRFSYDHGVHWNDE